MSEFPWISGYKILREIGQGGMATVYLAVQENLNRDVAIKVLSPVLFVDREFKARFLREAETAAKFRHANIVPIYNVGQVENVNYIVMEYFEEGLKEILKNGPLDPERAIRVMRDVAGALSYAHEQGIIHRDIKPENIMFRADGSAVLTDFGIAKAVGTSTKLTKTGISIGTPHYMSPEQARGKELDGRSDIYSLGVVLFEMLTGRVPYDAKDSVAIAIKHIQEPIPRLPAHLIDYQPLLDWMMAKNRDERPARADELISERSKGEINRDIAEEEIVYLPAEPVEKVKPQRVEAHEELVPWYITASLQKKPETAGQSRYAPKKPRSDDDSFAAGCVKSIFQLILISIVLYILIKFFPNIVSFLASLINDILK